MRSVCLKDDSPIFPFLWKPCVAEPYHVIIQMGPSKHRSRKKKRGKGALLTRRRKKKQKRTLVRRRGGGASEEDEEEKSGDGDDDEEDALDAAVQRVSGHLRINGLLH